jgi:uncharacterized protein
MVNRSSNLMNRSNYYADPDHSEDELRFLTFGISHQGRLLVVSHANRQDRVRIINAREATRNEPKIYEED